MPRTKRKMKVGKTVAKMAQSQLMGNEPIVNGQIDKVTLIKAFNWYGTEQSVSDSKKYLESYFKSRGIKNMGWIRSIPDAVFPLTAGWMARIIDRGGILPSYLDGRIEQRLKEAKKYVKIEQAQVDNEPKKVTVQDRLKSRVDMFLCELEGYLDDDRSVDLYDKLVKFQFPSTAVKHIIELLQPRRDEVALVISGKLKEGYDNYTKAQLKEMLSAYDRWIADAKRYGNNQKTVRKLRVPKPVSTEKLTKNIKFQAESKEHKIVSATPAQVIGSKEVWLYNTKYGNLTVLRTEDNKGMTFKASKVIGYNPELSVTKKVSRKAGYFLKEVLSRTRSKLKKLMGEANTTANDPADRINENTLILRVFKD